MVNCDVIYKCHGQNAAAASVTIKFDPSKVTINGLSINQEYGKDEISYNLAQDFLTVIYLSSDPIDRQLTNDMVLFTVNFTPLIASADFTPFSSVAVDASAYLENQVVSCVTDVQNFILQIATQEGNIPPASDTIGVTPPDNNPSAPVIEGNLPSNNQAPNTDQGSGDAAAKPNLPPAQQSSSNASNSTVKKQSSSQTKQANGLVSQSDVTSTNSDNVATQGKPQGTGTMPIIIFAVIILLAIISLVVYQINSRRKRK
ncbi:MAG: hypothetical protein RR234_01630 [Christensenella sp.]